MIHARIDTVDHRKIVGFETGTRQTFDKSHGGDPLWVFLDAPKVKYRANFADFLVHPTNYKISTTGYLQSSSDPPIVVVDEEPVVPPGYKAAIGRDGRYLKGTDGDFIIVPDPGYVPPPSGNLYLLDDDNVFLTDPDGAFVIEPV